MKKSVLEGVVDWPVNHRAEYRMQTGGTPVHVGLNSRTARIRELGVLFSNQA